MQKPVEASLLPSLADGPIAACVVAPGGELVWCNGAFALLLRHVVGGLVGRPFLALVNETYRAQVSEQLLALQEGGPEWQARVALDSGMGPLVVRLAMRAGPAQQVLCWCWPSVGATDPVDGDQELRLLYQSTPALLHAIGADGRIEHVSDAWLTHFGFARGEVIGRYFVEFLTPESRRYAMEVVVPRYRETWRCDDIPYQLVNKQGELRDILLSAVSIRHTDGIHRSTLSIVRDVTDELAQSKRLVETNERLAALMASLPDYVFELDGDGTYLRYSAPVGGETYLPPEQFVGRRVVDVLPPPVGTQLQESVEAAARTGAPSRFEFELPSPNGSLVYESRVSRTGVGTVLALVRDVTESRAAERKLRSTVEALDQFAYIASHDLRSPLRGVRQLASWIEEDAGPALPDNVRPHLEKMRRRLERMEEMLDALRRFARAGHLDANAQEIDLAAMVDEMETQLREDPSLGFARFRVERGSLPTLQSARAPLWHVLVNLLSNAARHHDRETGTIRISAQQEGSWWWFYVEDDGPGIDPRYHQQVFQLFKTLYPRDARDTAGMGLGIVRRLAHAVGGEILIESPLAGGRGSRFRVRWPATWMEASP